MSDTQDTTATPNAPTGWTQDDVNRLKTSIAAAGNAQSVTYSDGAQVRYLPVGEALALLARMEADVRAAVAVALPAVADPMRRRVRSFVGHLRSPY